MKKFLLLLIVISSISTVLFAAGESGDDTPFIGIAMPETHVERWVRDGAELKESAEAKGFRAEVAFADGDQSKQNKQIEDFVTKGADLIIVGAINEGAAEAVAKAKEEGVSILSYDRLITNSDAYEYYITFDNFKVGVEQGTAIANALGLASASDTKYISLFAGSPTDNNAFYFFDGALSVLKPYVDSGVLEIVGPAPTNSGDSSFTQVTTEGWRAEEAKKRMENLLNNEASGVVLDAVLAPNDPIGRAIIEALLTDAKYANALPVVTGQDGEVASIKLIRDGKQAMTVFKDTRMLSRAAIELATAILSDNSAPQIAGARIDTESYNTGKKSVTSYLLEPITVGKDNYKEVLIDSGYYTQDQIDN